MSHFHFVDLQTGESSPPFAHGYHLGSAYVHQDVAYAFGVEKWGAASVRVFSSRDLSTWSHTDGLVLPGWQILSTSVCSDPKGFVMAFEIDAPPEETGVPYTVRFARSQDLRAWVLTPSSCVSAKDRYTACPTIRFFGGWYYLVYLETLPGPRYGSYIVRSKDLETWDLSPLNPFLSATEEDRLVASPSCPGRVRWNPSGSSSGFLPDGVTAVDLAVVRGGTIMRKAKAFRFLAMVSILLACCAAAAMAQQPAVVKLWNWNIHDKKYQQNMYKLFNQRHPDIKIEFSSIANTVYGQTLEAAFIAKDPPDLFLPSGKLTWEYLLGKNWIMPLNDVAQNDKELKDWMSQFPPYLNKFVEGLSMINGKPYVVSLGGESGLWGVTPVFPLFWNRTLFSQAGLGNAPATQSELRQDAAKITQTGQGKFYGVSHGLRYAGVWHQDIVGSLARAAGVQGAGGPPWGPSLQDGKYHANSPELITAMKTWMGMRTDGSVFPGEETMDDEQAKMAIATNKAAMFFGGDWVPGNLLAYNPDCDFDLVLPPTPDDGIRRFYYNVALQGAFGYFVSSFTKNPKAVWEVIKFISGLEYQEGYVKGGFGISYLPAADKPENFAVKQMYKFVQWANDPALRRIAPLLAPDIAQAYGRVLSEFAPGIYPPFMDTLTNVYLGTSRFDALADLDKRCDTAFDEGIKKANEAGLKVKREDFFFPDWDPSKDYVQKK